MKKLWLSVFACLCFIHLNGGTIKDFQAAQNEFRSSRWLKAAEKFLALEKKVKGPVKEKVLSYAAIALASGRKVKEANAAAARITAPDWKAYTTLRILSATGKHRQIVKDFASADINSWSEDIAYLGFFNRGRSFFYTRQYPRAIADLEKCAADAGSDNTVKILALNSLIHAAWQNKNTAAAVKYADQVIRITSHRGFHAYLDSCLSKARILAQEKKFADAEKTLADFNRGRNWKGGGVWYFHYLVTCGDVALAQGKKAQAKEFYNRALSTKNVAAGFKKRLQNKMKSIK